MALKPAMLRMLLLTVTVAAFCTAAFGDTIRLKDGGILKGKIVAFSGGRFTLAIGEGSRKRELSLSITEIESIEFDDARPPQTTASNARPSDTAAAQRSPEPSYRQTAATPEPVVADEPAVLEEEPAEQEIVETVEPARPQPVRPSGTSSAKPVELSVKVLADNTSNGWTNSGWVVKAGQKIRISGSGEVSIGDGKKSSPSGLYDVEDGQKLLRNVPTAALIAVIGDDNNEFIYIGAEREFVATRDGTLFLGLNEGNLDDNAGAFQVKIEIVPGE